MGVTWTEEQKQVIDLRHRNILVSAAAGSGKTAVLVERMIAMITDEEHPVDIDRLLVVTFTKAAAAEMKERIGKAIEKKIEEDPENEHLEKQSALLPSALITTIDSFCLHVIRNHFNEIDLDPSFRVADETELALLKSDTMEKLLEDMYEEGSEAFHHFVEGYARGKTDQNIEALILQTYEYSRSYPWPREWLDSCVNLLEISSVDDLKAHPLIISLEKYVRQVLSDLITQLRQALNICYLADGPLFYDSAIASDIKMLSAILAKEDFFEMQEPIADIRWEALSRKKMPQASDENKNKVKTIRDLVKKKMKDIRSDFFFTDAETMLQDIQMAAGPMKTLVTLVKAFSLRFQKIKEEKNILDFGDLEHFALNILVRVNEDGTKTRSDVAVEMSRQFVEVMCDEYQDSNLVQETILNAVSRVPEGQPNIFMVGDVKQSIYKFRQARPELFMEKYHAYDVTESLYQRIDLHKNFRSRPCVVHFVNLIFEHLMGPALGGIEYDESAALNPGADFPDLEKRRDTESISEDAYISKETEVLLVDVTSSEEDENHDDEDDLTDREMEAKAIASKIRGMMNSGMMVMDPDTRSYRPVQYRDMVILLRSMKGWSDVFTDVLMSEGIPAHSEASGGFFDTMEIRTAVSLLNVIDNPIQDIELAAVLKSCIGQMTDEDLAMIRSVHKRGTFYDACQEFLKEESDVLLESYDNPEKCRDVRKRLGAFFDQIERFRQMSVYMSIHQLIRRIFEETGYEQMMGAMPMGERRRANLELLIEKAVTYEQTSYRGLFNFVRYISRLKTQNTEIGEASVLSDTENAVRIISIHKSKGLEYPVVFVSGMNKRFNTQDIRSSVLLHPDYGFGMEAVNLDMRTIRPTILKKALAQQILTENLSEELRILYVALTRAKERLIITASVKNPEKKMEAWEKTSACASDLLLFADLVSASSCLDWIMPVLLHKDYRADSDAEVLLQIRRASELIVKDAVTSAANVSVRSALSALVCQQNAAEEMHIKKWADKHFIWTYPYESVFRIPAKMTVSEIKKMYGEEDPDAQKADFLSSGFDDEDHTETGAQNDMPEEEIDIEERMRRAALRGTAVHKVMELLDYSQIHSVADVRDFIGQCVQNHHLSEEIAGQINPWKIYRFVQSDLGRRMAGAQTRGDLHREQQFIMAVDAGVLFGQENISGEDVLTQGIIDAWFEEDGKIVLVDYKTDYVPEGDGHELVSRYRAQLAYYQKALERITHLPVSEKYIYAFKLDKAVEVQ